MTTLIKQDTLTETRDFPIRWFDNKAHILESVQDRSYIGLMNKNGYHPSTRFMRHSVDDSRFPTGGLAYAPITDRLRAIVFELRVVEPNGRFIICADVYAMRKLTDTTADAVTAKKIDTFTFRRENISELDEHYRDIAAVAWENLVWWRGIATDESLVMRSRHTRLEGHRSCIRMLSQVDPTYIRFSKSGENYAVRTFNKPPGLYHISLTRIGASSIKTDLIWLPVITHSELCDYAPRHMVNSDYELVEITLKSGFKAKGIHVVGVGYKFAYRYGQEVRSVFVKDELINNVVTI